jgi:hypothetical protein
LRLQFVTSKLGRAGRLEMKPLNRSQFATG